MHQAWSVKLLMSKFSLNMLHPILKKCYILACEVMPFCLVKSLFPGNTNQKSGCCIKKRKHEAVYVDLF